ncbi:MAG: hypothetical protein SV429_10500 [Pseudomonadota bacterium]|nr:hypothetical protein [Pseudomonadota bacterium]
MFPDLRSHPHLAIRYQQGIGLPIALFVITVLALLVVGMAQLQQATGQSVSLQIQSQRAFYAAESGAQLAVARVLEGAPDCTGVPSTVKFSTAGLAGCRADIDCHITDPVTIPGGGNDRVATLQSHGRCGADNDPSQASRTVEVRVR